MVRRGQLRGPGGFQKCTILKTIPAELLVNPSQREKVVGVISQAAQLAHPSIAQIYDATLGVNTEEFNVVSECVDGYTVGTIVERAMSRGIPLPAHVIVWILRSVVDALIFARDHTATSPLPLVHGHLHPNNILIREDGQIKVTDFGLAASLGASAFIPRDDELSGTYGYMAPEQIGRWQIEERTDVFALGVLLYELSLGEHPFVAATDLQVCQAVQRGLSRPPRSIFPNYPEPLEQIIEHCLAINPSLRFHSLDEFRIALLAAFEGDTGAATRASMAAMLTILFPEQAHSHSGKWQVPTISAVGSRDIRPEPSELLLPKVSTPADKSERQTWLLAFAALAVISALFWLLLYPSL